jgi:hypothetical protein
MAVGTYAGKGDMVVVELTATGAYRRLAARERGLTLLGGTMPPSSYFGAYLAVWGDIDNDGVVELLAGAEDDRVTPTGDNDGALFVLWL